MAALDDVQRDVVEVDAGATGHEAILAVNNSSPFLFLFVLFFVLLFVF
jgi:hypothetical protein